VAWKVSHIVCTSVDALRTDNINNKKDKEQQGGRGSPAEESHSEL
jgi:hypothetical protein